MFDRYLLVEDTLKNVEEAGAIVGWSVDTRIGYYRGLGLSMVDVALEVDGQPVPRESIRLRLHGKEYRLTELGDVLDDRWGFGEAVTLFVELPGGLTPGEHEVTFHQWLRVSYLPFPSENHDEKLMSLA